MPHSPFLVLRAHPSNTLSPFRSPPFRPWPHCVAHSSHVPRIPSRNQCYEARHTHICSLEDAPSNKLASSFVGRLGSATSLRASKIGFSVTSHATRIRNLVKEIPPASTHHGVRTMCIVSTRRKRPDVYVRYRQERPQVALPAHRATWFTPRICLHNFAIGNEWLHRR